jgi:hypothetical protein
MSGQWVCMCGQGYPCDHDRGPSPCRCNCGYSCGRTSGGSCDLDLFACIEQHYRRDCDHDFNGPMEHHTTPGGGATSSVTCTKCGMEALDHDMAVGP